MSRAAAAQAGGAGPLRVGAALAGVVLAAVLLFSLGVMTGTRIAAHAPAAPSAPAAHAPAAVATAPAVTAPATVALTAPPPTGPAGALTFYDRLSGAAPPLPAIQPDDSAERRAAAPPAPPAEKPLPNEATEPPTAQPPVPAAHADGDTGSRVRGLMAKGPYSVQVAALTDRQAATAAAERLKAQGLPAATVAATSKGKTWYRLRVGTFPSREAAARAAGLLHAELGLAATPVRD